MRLIDVDAIKTVDYSGLAYISPNDYKGIADYFYEQLVVNQPTAYDVDKVVEQLKKLKSVRSVKDYASTGIVHDYVDIKEAIEIIEGGGVNE